MAVKAGAVRDRVVVARYGRRPNTVTVVSMLRRGDRVTVVFWRERGDRREQTIEGRTKREQEQSARAFAEQKHAALLMRAQGAAAPTPRERLTLDALHRRYLLAEGRSWAPNTVKNHHARWQKFVDFVGVRTIAEDVTLETMDEFAAAMKAHGHVVGEIDRMITCVKSVYRHGQGRVTGFSSPVPIYRLKKLPGDRSRAIPEYAPAEVRKLLAELKPTGQPKIGRNGLVKDWRAWSLCWMTAASGKRTKSQMLPLKWTDVQFVRGGAMVEWPWETDKLRREHRQPMPRRAAAMLRLIRWLARRDGVHSAYVWPARKDKETRRTTAWCSYAGLVRALHQASGRCGVRHIKGRAMHGFRRYSANTAYEIGGGVKAAGLWLNDVDLRTIDRAYLREREGEQGTIASAMPSPDGRTKRVRRSPGARTTARDGNGGVPNDGPTTDAPAGAEASRSEHVVT